MKKRIITFIVVAMRVLVYALPASAHTPGPCNDSNADGTFSGVEDPVVGTTRRDKAAGPFAVFRGRREATIYPILGSLKRHL